VLVANWLDDASGVQDHSVMEPVSESTRLEQDQEPAGSWPGQIPFLLWMCDNAGGTACGARRRIAPTLGQSSGGFARGWDPDGCV